MKHVLSANSPPPSGVPVVRARATINPLGSYLVLVKPRIVTLVVFTAVVACFAASSGQPPAHAVAILILSGALAAGGAAALNHYFDRDIDASMARTRGRPLAQGDIQRPQLVLAIGIAMIVVGVIAGASLSPLLGFFELLGAIVYAGVYTLWLKRRTAVNVVVGGVAGSSAVLGGWAAADASLGAVPWLLAALVFFWTPAHFWGLALARSEDYARVGVPMLPTTSGARLTARWTCVHIAATVALSLLVWSAAGLGAIYLSLALVAGVGVLLVGVRLWRQPGPTAGWSVFKFSGPYLGLVFLGVFLDTLF
ncbi:MAG TPA: heme o synthase [Chloroflexota bacterium]|nr:heme o synthase [Chloroflexota bacterium]